MKILNPSALGGGGGASSGIVNHHVSQWRQVRASATYSAPNSGDGTEIALLTTAVTPAAAGNRMLIEFYLGGEVSGVDIVFNVSRNGTLLDESTDGSNNRWAGIVAQQHDTQFSSTPEYHIVSILDTNTLAIESTYRLLVRASNATARTFYFNRSVTSAGADGQERTLSRTQLTEFSA